LRVLFGCGGDRDRTKRPRMAAVACELADAVYVTSDNPRTEDPRRIIDEILFGVPGDARHKVLAEVDRRTAIERIVSDAGDGDVVLIAGKGHEAYQIIGDRKVHFDDAEEAQRCLAAANHT
jgi:UDP-N-acetylmuramoyl-L-alanyl-D-glutamate--2,6-diaminopimelate ligase